MTASNAFVGPDAAYLLTDTAVTAETGNVLTFTRKAVASGPLRVAACIAGEGTVFKLEDGSLMSPLGNVEDVFEQSATQEDAFAALPAAIAAGYEAVSSITGGTGKFRVLIAAWWMATREPRVYFAFTAGYGPAEMKPFALNRLNFMLAPDIPHIDPSRLRERQQARRLIEAQRRKPWPDGIYRIGGCAELTTVDGDGVRTERLCSWPDRIGRAVSP